MDYTTVNTGWTALTLLSADHVGARVWQQAELISCITANIGVVCA